ncbi:MAG: DUF928 domain-containing protein [Nodosilinea sp.]
MKIQIKSALGLLMIATGTIISSSTVPATAKDAPPNDMPGRRVGAGVRQPGDACMTSSQSQVAIIPVNNVGVTSQAEPTLLFYVPTVDSSRTIEFVLRDEADQEVYDKTVAANGESGIIRLDLAEDDTVRLEAGKNYQWYFSVVCNPSDRSQDISSHGWIHRMATEAAGPGSLPTEASLAQARSYAEAGLWLDALAELDTLRRAQPANGEVARLWEEWLQMPTLSLGAVLEAAPIDSPFEHVN